MDDQNQQPAQTKYTQVLQILKEKGWDDEKISELTTELTNAAFKQFYAEAVMSFTEEDMTEIDEIEDDMDAQKRIKELYRERTGKDADEESARFFDVFAEGFLKENAEHPDN